MRRFIGASEGATVYIFALCGGSILTRVISTLLGALGSNYALANWILIATTQIAFLLVVFGYMRWRKVDTVNVVGLKKFANPKQWLLVPVITIATIITFLPISNLFMKLLFAMGFSGSVGVPPITNAGYFVLAVLIVAVLPAFGEEFVMRGALFSGLRSWGTTKAIFISALLFSLMHANALQTVHQFGLGIILALVVLISGSVFPAVVIHFLNNFFSLIMSTYIPEIDEFYISLGSYQYLTDIVSIVVGAIMLVMLLYLFYRFGEGKQIKTDSSDGLVFEEFKITVSAEQKAETAKARFRDSAFAGMFSYFFSLFTKNGWAKTARALNGKNDVPYLGKSQPMFNVWLALGFAVVYWVLAFVMGLVG